MSYKMTLFKKEKLGKKTRSRYKLGTSAKELSRKVFGMKGLEVNKSVIINKTWILFLKLFIM